MTTPDLRETCHCARHGIGPHWHSLLEGCPREPVELLEDDAPTPPLLRSIERFESGPERVQSGSECDPVNSPSHYTWLPGVEVIDITEQLNFCMGNAIKYILRADRKGKPLEDLAKARWYIDRELDRRTREQQDAAPLEQPGAGA